MELAYQIAKQIHVLTALISVTGFALRGFWMIQDSPTLKHRAVKILPHLNDTILLTTAITLALITHQYPGSSSWLTAKVCALLVYIGLGMVAFRFGKTRRIRIIAWSSAILVFGYIVGVAINRTPMAIF